MHLDLTLVPIPSPHFELGSESHYYRSVPLRSQLQTLLELTEKFILIILLQLSLVLRGGILPHHSIAHTYVLHPAQFIARRALMFNSNLTLGSHPNRHRLRLILPLRNTYRRAHRPAMVLRVPRGEVSKSKVSSFFLFYRVSFCRVVFELFKRGGTPFFGFGTAKTRTKFLILWWT